MTREIEARLKISAIDRTGSVLKNVGNKLSEVNRRVSAFNRAQSETLALMSRYLAPAALAYGLKESLVQFAEVERRMTRIGITAGVSREQTQATTEALRRMAGEYAMSFDDVVKGLDTLVSSGLSLQEAMAFLPAVLKTAQATGSATEDIANTALKASSALKIAASDMDKAFDIMVAGGKAGQFELKDMAQYIPGLANSFATLGYEGEDGLKKLIAVLQTIREDTGDASAAATQAQNIFGKMYSEETANKFKKFGIDLRKEMQAAKAAGKDALTAFVDLSKKAIDGDLSKLPLLFSDQEFRLGMQSLITSPESLKKFLDLLNGADVNGTVLRDLGVVLQDTQAKIDRLSNSWTDFYTKLGASTAGVVAPGLDSATKFLDDRMAESAGLKKFRTGNSELDDNTINEFYKRAGDMKVADGNWATYGVWRKAIQALGRGEVNNVFEYLNRESMRTDSTGVLRGQYSQYRPGKGGGVSIPVPVPRPKDLTPAEQMAQAYSHGTGRDQIGNSLDTLHRLNNVEQGLSPLGAGSLDDFAAQVKQGLQDGGTEGGQALGDEATRRLAAEMATLGQQLGQAAAAAIRAAVGNLNVNVKTAGVNANTGRTNDFVRTPGTGRQ